MKAVLDTNVLISGIFFGGPPGQILDAWRDAPPLPGQVSDDPEDDKFLACALAGRTRFIISGDKHLLRVSGYRGITVLKPREFLTDVLQYP